MSIYLILRLDSKETELIGKKTEISDLNARLGESQEMIKKLDGDLIEKNLEFSKFVI